MTVLLELRDKFKMIYSKNEVFILPVIKFLLAFITLTAINGQMGYMSRIDNAGIVLVAALACSFLPVGAVTLFSFLFILLHLYSLSLEVAVVGLVVCMLIYLMSSRFAPKNSVVISIIPLLYFMKIPYILPVILGLLGTPVISIAAACGVVLYYLILAVTVNASTINTMGTEDAVSKIRLVLDTLLGSKAMMVTVVAFVITIIVVYIIRRMSVDHSWTIAMAAGVVLNVVIMLVGDLIYETNISVLGVILGNILGMGIAKVIEFFRFCVDYSRTEKVQFEDDEYYYYVKAVPKMTVAAPTKTVKHINTQRVRSVSTERTRRENVTRRNSSVGRQSVTIGNQRDEVEEDYEELF